MIDEELKKRISEAIFVCGNSEDPLGVLRDFKLNGGQQRDALDTLENMRIGATEEYEDRILEIMDYASGFCSPQSRIW